MLFPDSTACFRPRENGQLLTKLDRFTNTPRQISSEIAPVSPPPIDQHRQAESTQVSRRIFRTSVPLPGVVASESRPGTCSDLSVNMLTQYTRYSHHNKPRRCPPRDSLSDHQ